MGSIYLKPTFQEISRIPNVQFQIVTTSAILPLSYFYLVKALGWTVTNGTSGQYNTMQCNDNPGQPKTNVIQKQMSIKNKCQLKTNVNLKQMSIQNKNKVRPKTNVNQKQ